MVSMYLIAFLFKKLIKVPQEMGPAAVLFAKPVLVIFSPTAIGGPAEKPEVPKDFSATDLCNIWAGNPDYRCQFRKYICDMVQRGALWYHSHT